MGPANVDPVQCARFIVYACMSAASGESDDAPSTAIGSDVRDNLRHFAGVSDQPYLTPDIVLMLVCVLSSVAVVVWSIAKQ
jgi:hypothetical protein